MGKDFRKRVEMGPNVSGIYQVERSTRLSRPLFLSRVPAGFPSPAEDYVESRIDLNRDLILHPLATYYARIEGDSMIGADIPDGSFVAFDCAAETNDGDVVIARVEDQMCCKILREGTEGGVWLEPANPDYQPIIITEEMDFQIIGLVLFSFKWHAKHHGHRLRTHRCQ
jgi:DNA polymerase V